MNIFKSVGLSACLLLYSALPVALTGCVGVVSPGYGYVGPDYGYYGPDVAVFGGGWVGPGHWDRDFSRRGAISRGFAGHGGGFAGHGGGGHFGGGSRR